MYASRATFRLSSDEAVRCLSNREKCSSSFLAIRVAFDVPLSQFPGIEPSTHSEMVLRVSLSKLVLFDWQMPLYRLGYTSLSLLKTQIPAWTNQAQVCFTRTIAIELTIVTQGHDSAMDGGMTDATPRLR